MKTIIFACVHNAGRSQMAAAFLNHLSQFQTPNSNRLRQGFGESAGALRAKADLPGNVHAVSAGTSPAERVHPEVVDVMREVGIDLSAAKPQKLTLELAQTADLLITMGCGDQCPYVPGLKVEDWPLEDPKGKSIERVRQIRDEIRARVETLVTELPPPGTNEPPRPAETQ